MMTLAKTRLAPVEEDREESHDLLTEKIVTKSRPLGCSIRSKPTCWCIAVIVFQLFYGGLIYYLAHEIPPTRTCLKGNEAIYEDVPVRYESIAYRRAGFHDSHHSTPTPFEGKPNAKNDAAWDRITSVGVVSLSDAEAGRLTPIGTSRSDEGNGPYMVEIAMFHQLHCLKTIRNQLWEFEENLSSTDSDDSKSRSNHFDHCIDYLRQVLMCHGDLTPITFEWNEETQGYIAHHGDVAKCRNFERVFEWAKGRDDTGVSVNGEHQNVDLLTTASE